MCLWPTLYLTKTQDTCKTTQECDGSHGNGELVRLLYPFGFWSVCKTFRVETMTKQTRLPWIIWGGWEISKTPKCKKFSKSHYSPGLLVGKTRWAIVTDVVWTDTAVATLTCVRSVSFNEGSTLTSSQLTRTNCTSSVWLWTRWWNSQVKVKEETAYSGKSDHLGNYMSSVYLFHRNVKFSH